MSDQNAKRKAATTRAKEAKLAAVLHSPEDLERAVSTYATLELTLESLSLEAEAELKAISERWNGKINKVRDELADLLPQIEDYTRKFRKALFKTGAKTVSINGHELSLHLTPPKVETKRGVTQKQVLAALLEHPNAEWADAFVRWTEALNKEAILGKWNTETNSWQPEGEALAELGIEITQTEQFALKTNRVLGASKTTAGEALAA